VRLAAESADSRDRFAIFRIPAARTPGNGQDIGDTAHFHLDGLAPLVIATQGPILLLANSAEMLKLVLARAPGRRIACAL